MLNESQILSALSKVVDPELNKDLVSLNMIKDLKIDGSKVSFTIELTTPACPLRNQIENDARNAVSSLEGVKDVQIKISSSTASKKLPDREPIEGVKNIIAVGSGKGGVGKSTVSVNLALALSSFNAKVGLLDADIYGPNIPQMMGVNQPLRAKGEKIEPINQYGIKVMSIGFIVPNNTPVIWRGPMLIKAIQQFLRDVNWGNLDYLIVDIPPGTGDVQLTLAQSVPVTGAVIVTTPQEVSLSDAIKGLGTFSRLGIPVLGIIENMSYFLCPHCQGRTEIFSHGGAKEASKKLGVPFLGEVPIDLQIRSGGDEGKPILVSYPDSPQSKIFKNIASTIAGQISVLNYGFVQR